MTGGDPSITWPSSAAADPDRIAQEPMSPRSLQVFGAVELGRLPCDGNSLARCLEVRGMP
jgi:hypothetical protein